MTSASELERAVARLAPDDLVPFRTCFERFDAEMFDRKITGAAAAGRLDTFAEEDLSRTGPGALREL